MEWPSADRPAQNLHTPDVLQGALAESVTVARTGPEELEIEGLTGPEIGELARALGIALHHLNEIEHSLEHAYLQLTTDDVEYHGGTTGASA